MVTTIQLTSGDHLVAIAIEEDDGSKTEKKITLENLNSIFKTESKNEYYCRNRLFDHMENVGNIEGLIYGMKEDTFMQGIFFVPAAKRYMNVAGEETLMPYPSLLFTFLVKAGYMRESMCYAMMENEIDKIRPDSKLYAFPFGNVNTESHRICWGNNTLGTLFEYEDLRRVIATFFYSESNMDYVTAGISFNMKYKTYKTFLGTIKKEEEFPQDALVACRNDLTFYDVFHKVYNLKKESMWHV